MRELGAHRTVLLDSRDGQIGGGSLIVSFQEDNPGAGQRHLQQPGSASPGLRERHIRMWCRRIHIHAERIGAKEDSIDRFTFQAELSPFHAWLASYGLPSGGTADYLDPDGDGLNNWQEYLAGTSPTNADSVFKITGGQTLPSGHFVLRWSSVSNRLYDIARSTNLDTGASAFVAIPGATNLHATSPQNTWTDSVNSASTSAFYRVSAHP